MSRLKDVPSERKSSREFHSAIAEATKNDLLIKLYAVVSNAFPDWLLYEALFRYPELFADSMTSTYKEHVAIVDALKKGDAETSRAEIHRARHGIGQMAGGISGYSRRTIA